MLTPEPGTHEAIRRADWRWLLPNPCPARAVCFRTDGLLEAAVACVSDRVIAPSDVTPGSCDLAVCVDPTPSTVRAAWDALQPDGTLYSEWTHPGLGGTRRVHQHLHATGFGSVQLYWPWPSPVRAPPRVWLPLASRGARRYLLQRRRRLTRLAWTVAYRTQILSPICAVARKSFPHTEAAHRLLLTSGPRITNKVVALVFGDGEPSANLVVKLPRVADANADLRREAEVLHQLPGHVHGVPRVVFVQDDAAFAALGETVLDGAPLYSLVRGASYRCLALAATDWLIHLAGGAPRAGRTEFWPRLIEPRLAEFQAAFGSLADSAALADTRRRLEKIESLPLVFEQNDFWSGNVLVDGRGRLGVLDWEAAEPCGLPLVDLLYFLADLAFVLDKTYNTQDFARAYRSSLDPQTFIGSVRHECLARYAAALRLSTPEIDALRLLVWLPHATSDLYHLDHSADGRAIRFYSMWQEEVRAICAGAAA